MCQKEKGKKETYDEYRERLCARRNKIILPFWKEENFEYRISLRINLFPSLMEWNKGRDTSLNEEKRDVTPLSGISSL